MEEDDLKTAEFNRITDRYMRAGVMASQDYEKLTPRQKDCIQWAKRAFNRLTEDKHARQARKDTEGTESTEEPN